MPCPFILFKLSVKQRTTIDLHHNPLVTSGREELGRSLTAKILRAHYCDAYQGLKLVE